MREAGSEPRLPQVTQAWCMLAYAELQRGIEHGQRAVVTDPSWNDTMVKVEVETGPAQGETKTYVELGSTSSPPSIVRTPN